MVAHLLEHEHLNMTFVEIAINGNLSAGTATWYICECPVSGLMILSECNFFVGSYIFGMI